MAPTEESDDNLMRIYIEISAAFPDLLFIVESVSGWRALAGEGAAWAVPRAIAGAPHSVQTTPTSCAG